MAVNGLGVTYMVSGFLLVWSGLKNITLKDEITSFASGTTPTPNPTGPPSIGIASSSGSSTSGTSGSSSSSGSSGSSSTSGAATVPPTSSGNVRQALINAAKQKGWTSAAELSALDYVEMREAGYNLTAQNPTSSAYGIAQFINGPSEYYTYGGNPNTADGQAVAMVNYIAQRYGDPIAAAAHERQFNWY